MQRTFKPAVIETKQELLTALQNGKIKSSKYNVLNDNEKLFVELVAFGDYNAEQAMKVINPKLTNARAGANRMLSNPDVAAALEEFSVQRDKKFMAEISSARDQALSKLRYIMNTTNDEAVAAACAKTILDKAEKAVTKREEDDNKIEGVRFKIEVANVYNAPVTEYDPKGRVVVDMSVPEEDIIDVPTVDPVTGNPYQIFYEGIDSYNKK